MFCKDGEHNVYYPAKNLKQVGRYQCKALVHSVYYASVPVYNDKLFCTLHEREGAVVKL